MTRELPANWSNAILVCAKCSKRQHGGFGPKQKTPLAKALRKALHLKKGRKARAGIVEVKCFGVCPRDAVTVVNTRQPGLWRLVWPGTDVEDVATELGLDQA